MIRNTFLMIFGLLALAACAAPPPISVGPDGQPQITVYQIPNSQRDDVQFRMFDGINALRREAGLQDVEFDAALIAAAATHSRDMSVQNRPWHFGSDGSSPLDRVARAGYGGQLLGENISETYETELETLAAWMEQPATRRVILDPDARKMGFSWHQERNGKIWWTLILGT